MKVNSQCRRVSVVAKSPYQLPHVHLCQSVRTYQRNAGRISLKNDIMELYENLYRNFRLLLKWDSNIGHFT